MVFEIESVWTYTLNCLEYLKPCVSGLPLCARELEERWPSV